MKRRTFVAGEKLSDQQVQWLNSLMAKLYEEERERCQHHWKLRCVLYEGHEQVHKFDIGMIPTANKVYEADK